jgi:hypothetical protein
MKTLQKFSSVHAAFTTTSTRTATSSAERHIRRNAQPPWLSGRRSTNWLCAPCPQVRVVETSSHWTDSTR